MAEAIHVASGNYSGSPLLELRANVVAQYREQAVAALAATKAGFAAFVAEADPPREVSLRRAARIAANLVDDTAKMLEHLVMDTSEDQDLNDTIVTTHRLAAAAIRTAIDAPAEVGTVETLDALELVSVVQTYDGLACEPFGALRGPVPLHVWMRCGKSPLSAHLHGRGRTCSPARHLRSIP